MKTFPQVAAFKGNDSTIRIIGHRGARGIMPENSMIGFELTLSNGVSLLEFDVILTADRIPVITHNHHVHAPTFRDKKGFFVDGIEPKISELTFAEIESFDIGRTNSLSIYGKRFPEQAQFDGIRVPRLSELLALVNKPEYLHAHLMLEVKSDPIFADDTQAKKILVHKIVQEIRSYSLEGRTILHSFDWGLLAECQRQAPDMPTSFLTELPNNTDGIGEDSSNAIGPDLRACAADIPDMVKKEGGLFWCPYFKDVTVKSIKHAQNIGLCVGVWTVNEEIDIDKMIDFGVDAIVTDYPERLQQRLFKRGFIT